MRKYLVILFLLFAYNTYCIDNQQHVDSLLKILPNVKTDTAKISLLINISNAYRKFETENSLKYCNLAINLSKEINNEEKLHQCYVVKGLINYRLGNNNKAIANFMIIINNTDEFNYTKGKAYLNVGNVFADLGKYDSSIIFYDKALIVFDKLGDNKNKAGVLNNIGTIHNDLGDFDEAIRYYTMSSKINEEYGNELGMASSTENIGIIYYYQKNYKRALEYFNKSLIIFKKVGRLDKLGNALNNSASMNILMDNKDTAIKQFQEAENIFKEMGDKGGQAEISQNLANIYFQNQNPEEGLKALHRAIKIYEELGIVKGLGICYKALGSHYFEIKNYKKSIEYYLIAKELWEPLEIKNDLRKLYHQLAEAYSKANNFKEASNYYKKYIAINDTIYNRERNNQIAEMQEKYDSESKEKEIKLQTIEIEKQNAEVQHQTKQKIWFGIGLGLALILLIVVFRGYQQKQKTNNIIINQKNMVEEKNKEIIDSINYAKRIQNALLKSEEDETNHLPEHFVFFNPKDIVSGDFYWAFEKQNYMYLAVADCTGHGVPGAFLTMLGTAFLNEITAIEGVLSPSQILDELRSKIIKELGQTGNEGENKDGMDMSLIRLDLKSKDLEWAGANNPLWLIKNNSEKDNKSMHLSITKDDKHLYEVKSDKQPISYFPKSKPFTNHKIKLEQKDTIYLFTDGFADQFGGPKGKKFKYKPFKELLFSLSNKKMKDQKEILETNFTDWKGDLEQIDDVCVVGIRI
jgi:tetratricopeptide (TPR) repeat protein